MASARLGWFLAACTLGLGGAADGALLAYDPFAYGDPANPAAGEYAIGDESTGVDVLGTQNPVIGPTAFYAGPWIQSGGDAQVVKALPSLAYPFLQAGVGGIQQETLQFTCCTFGRTGREIEGALGDLREERTIYESFLIDFGTQGTDEPTQFGLRGHELWNGGIGDTFRAVSLFLNHFAGTNVLTLAVTTPSGTVDVPVGSGFDLAALSLTNGGTHFVVMRYDFNGSDPDSVAVYLDPIGPNEPGTPDAQISVATTDLVITHHGAFSNFTFSGDGHVPGAIDEIRWGDTYVDVHPFVPEPGTALLLGAGLLLLRSRRRSS